MACSTVTVTKCQAALHTLQAFPFFRPTCLCREPHVDPDCNSFQNFLFDHPCIYVLKKGKFNARGPIIYYYYLEHLETHFLFLSNFVHLFCNKLAFPKIHGKNWCKFFFEIHEKRKKEISRAYSLYHIHDSIIFNKLTIVRFSSFSYIPISRNWTKSFREYIYVCNTYICRVVEFFPRRKIGFIGGNRENQLRSI